MSSHHDHNNHPQEVKPVAFRTPLILALVTVLVILLAVSTCDKKHGCCEDGEKCEASCEPKHGGHDDHNATKDHAVVEEHEDAVVSEETGVVADSLMKADTTHTAAPAKVEEHAHH
jgi:hypothetical protein